MSRSFLVCVFVCLIHSGLGLNLGDLAIGIRKVCQEQTRVSDADIRSGQTGDFDESNRLLACYMKCVLSRFEIMDKDGSLTIEKALMLLPEVLRSKFTAVAVECGGADEPDVCLKAGRMYKCFMQNLPNPSILF